MAGGSSFEEQDKAEQWRKTKAKTAEDMES